MSKEFTGIWMPASVLHDDRLTLAEKLLVAYTGSFPGRCFASDAHMAKMLGKSPKTITNMLSILRKKGIFSGRDFPKSGMPISRNPGYDIPKSGTIDISAEKSEKKKKKAASPHFSIYENGPDRDVLVGLIADRGLGVGEDVIFRTLDITLREVAAGHTPEPGNWPAFIAGRIRREARKSYKPVKVAPEPVSQFSKTYS